MAILTIGRVGLDVELPHPSEWREESTEDGREIMLRGWLRAGTTAEVQALRTELMNQNYTMVACTYTLDTNFDGFYVQTSIRVDTVPVSYARNIFAFEVTLFRIGSDSRTELQSLLTQAPVTNSHSTTPEYWWSPPVGALAINTGAGLASPTEWSRTTADGEIAVFRDIDQAADPTYSVSPATYYDGAVTLTTEGRVRTGQDFKSDPAYWEISNGLIRVRPSTYAGSSDGAIDFSWWSTSWGTDVGFVVKWQNSVAIPAWHYVTALTNTESVVTIRLVRDAATAPPSAHRHELDITVRRGSVYAALYYKYTGAASTHSIFRESTDAATGATGYIKDSGTISGHRWVLGTPQAHTQDTTNGGIVPTVSSRYFKAYIGAAIDDAASGTGDGPDEIRDQYTAWTGEAVRAVRR